MMRRRASLVVALVAAGVSGCTRACLWRTVSTRCRHVGSAVTQKHTCANSSDPGEGGRADASEKADVGEVDHVQPSELLRAAKLLKEKHHACGRGVRPPSPAVTKPLFFIGAEGEDEAGRQSEERHKHEHARADGASSGSVDSKSTSTPFLSKLHAMSEGLYASSFSASPTYDEVAEGRRKRLERKIEEERSRMLVFRDVGMDLDKPILSRDVFLIYKYIRYGVEFAIDNELERMLRYFNEHALNELKITHGSKLARGPATLSRKPKSCPRPHSTVAEAGNAGEGLMRAVSLLFPKLACTSLLHYCDAFPADAAATLAAMLSQGQSGLCPITSTKSRSEKAVYSRSSTGLWTSLSAKYFRRPAVVIFSQLGQRFGSTADLEWRHLAYSSICPQLLPHLPPVGDAPNAVIAGSRSDQKESCLSAMPIDVISIRSADLYKYERIHRLYGHRLAKSLCRSSSTYQSHPLYCALTCSTTFVGTRLLEPFYKSFALRNYLSPHIFLVDHEGFVRWLSCGCPDIHEKQYFPSLLRQLTLDYHRSRL